MSKQGDPLPGKKLLDDSKNKVKKQKETEMKTSRNWKQIIETLKTIAITALIAGIAGFYFGIQYKSNDQAVLQNQVKDVVSTIKVESKTQQ